MSLETALWLGTFGINSFQLVAGQDSILLLLSCFLSSHKVFPLVHTCQPIGYALIPMVWLRLRKVLQ
ncbi:hypothetical protein Gohar_013473 [Gossypium harknessii]|uniref:Uncharacterized protein n=1 Tax=Gossypium harknessii TaxID=34285 RepID=A0A7J9H1K4_9ROSI|nr:hypothetical protein [Gossypium harknessii]